MPGNCRLQCICLRIASISLWYICNRQILEDLGVAFFADHIRALTKRLDSKLDDEPLGRYLCRLSVDTRLLKDPKGDRSRQTCCDYLPKDGHVDILNHAQPALFDYPEVFFLPFSSVVRQMPG
jgi:hypothetical protein